MTPIPTFATALICMDGRIQVAAITYIQQRFFVDYVDILSEPGMDGVLARGPEDLVESYRRKAALSQRVHATNVVAVIAHDDCAGNPTTKEQHFADVRRALEVVRSWNLPVSVIGLWVDLDRQVHEII